jgi:uncharacterized protein (TIGR03083 family)
MKDMLGSHVVAQKHGRMKVYPKEGTTMLLGEAMERIDASWRRLWDTIGVAGPRDLERPGPDGGWSVKDVLGHIAYWEEWCLRRMRGGAPVADLDVDRINAEQVAARRDIPVERVRAELERVHATLMHELHNLTPVQLEEGTAPGSWLAANTWEHYDEHRDQVASILPHL